MRQLVLAAAVCWSGGAPGLPLHGVHKSPLLTRGALTWLADGAGAKAARGASEGRMTTAAQKWFDRLDKDGDGSVSVDEFLDGFDQLERELAPQARESVALAAEKMVTKIADAIATDPDRTVSLSLRRLKGDLEELEYQAALGLRLTETEIIALMSMTFISFTSPIFFTEKVVEVLIPSMAALAAALGITFEYVGKVAVSGGKEIAANALQAAAESEQQLAAAERAKAVLPLCAGVSASASAFALLAPALLEHLMPNAAVLASAEYFLLCPCVSILAAAIAALAAEDTAALCEQAKSVGERRFAMRSEVSATWLSVTERVERGGLNDRKKWLSFATSVLPAPLLATIFPATLADKCVLAAATAAAQAAYHLAKAVRAARGGTGPGATPRAPAVGPTGADRSRGDADGSHLLARLISESSPPLCPALAPSIAGVHARYRDGRCRCEGTRCGRGRHVCQPGRASRRAPTLHVGARRPLCRGRGIHRRAQPARSEHIPCVGCARAALRALSVCSQAHARARQPRPRPLVGVRFAPRF